jgi:nucleolar pre-ribosomal-associated protein 1
MALARGPGAAANPSVRELVLELLSRAAAVDGGALSLVTRCGVLAWLEMLATTATTTTEDAARAEALRARIVASCDAGRLEDWMANRRRKKPEEEQAAAAA